jgi:hypothetical protein
MSDEQDLPDFDAFARWLAARSGTMKIGAQHETAVRAAARSARVEFLRARQELALPVARSTSRGGTREVLQLFAAADRADDSGPPELMTARGFRVTLAYDEGSDTDAASIVVLVRCPPELLDRIEGQTAYLWNGSERFELGQFDAEGKAIGTLPVGIEISLSDFTLGRVKLEEPPSGEDG